jgi:hypothetical protein
MTNQRPLPPYTPSREMPTYTGPRELPPDAYPASPYSSYKPPGSQGRRPPTKRMATWALVLAVVPIPFGAFVAIGLALTVLTRPGHSRDHGKGRAVAAIVIASLWILAAIAGIALGLAGQADRNTAGVVTQRGDVTVSSLKVGDCVAKELPQDKSTLTVGVAPCGEVHAWEVYANFDLATGQYPGADEVVRLAEGGCAMRFKPFAGVGYNQSKLEVSYLYPLAATWSQERTVTCVVGATAPTTGTLRGSRR